MSFDFNIALTGIGPHSNTKLSSNMSSIQMALYADNGSGKSFISKSFKRISDLKYLDRTDQAQIDLLVEKSTAMVRFGEKQGILSLSIAPDGQPQKNLSVRFEIGSLPIVSDNTGLIYHVFNSEYVRENLEAVRYHPEDKVSGFILGKANIDLSKEKEQLENYKKAELEAIGKVRDMVASTQRELKAKGIQSNTKEYLAITFESVLRGETNSEDQSYTSLVEKYDILKSMPEHMQDISYRPFPDDIESFIVILENANEIIENKYTLSSFSEEFKKKFKVRIDKRKKLIEKLKDYLAIFFKDKYDFDEKQFSVVYQDRALIENTDYVLSDGEKSILAFCFFLANIHGVVENESDYNRLFLVIDDPVSSMDFNYVYNVAQAIRNIKKEPEIGRIRYLVLTHNMEFMSILVRNKIVSKKFLLSDGVISDFKDDYVMPYTANLLDIYKVSIGRMKPIHTIPNQIRHVLETTYRFEGSCGGFDDYILNNEILGKNGCLYSLIEDHSHGGLRTSKGYTDNMLIDSCRMVVDFIASKYPGQIEEVKRLSAQ